MHWLFKFQVRCDCRWAMNIMTIEWQKDLSAVMSIFCSNISYFLLGYSITPFKFYFLSDLAGCVFSPNEVWQESIYWMFQKHSYKNTVAYPGLCRTSRGYQGQSVVIFFQTHSFHLGKMGCVCVSSLFPGCQICVHVCISDFWMPSLCASAFQEWAKDCKCLRFLSQYVCTSVYGHELCQCVHTYFYVNWKEDSKYLFTPQCHWAVLQGQLRTEVYCVKGSITWGLSWASVWRLHCHIRASCLPLKYLDSEMPDQVGGGFVLPWALRTCVEGSQTLWNKSECCGHILLLLPGTLRRRQVCSSRKPGMALLQFPSPSGMDRETRGTERATKPSYAQHWNVLSLGQLGGQGLQDLQRKPVV